MKREEAAAVYVRPDELKPWGRNPRKGKPVAEVAESIRRFGFAAPIVARLDGTVIAGHTRLEAATQLGLERVPVRFVDLDEQEAAALALADNRLSELAEWDEDGLAAIGGSGTTLLAAASLGRVARLIELDPRYCDVIRRRWTRWARENNQDPGPGGLDDEVADASADV